MCQSCSGGSCLPCKIASIVFAIVYAATAIIAIISLYRLQVVAKEMFFGATETSVATIALIASMMAFMKMMKKICPCCAKGCKSGACTGNGCCTSDDAKMAPGMPEKPMMRK